MLRDTLRGHRAGGVWLPPCLACHCSEKPRSEGAKGVGSGSPRVGFTSVCDLCHPWGLTLSRALSLCYPCLEIPNTFFFFNFFRYAGLSLLWPLPLWSTGSGRTGSAAMAHGPSHSAPCGIFPDRGMNLRPLHRQADSQPLRHQGSPIYLKFDGPSCRGKSLFCFVPKG